MQLQNDLFNESHSKTLELFFQVAGRYKWSKIAKELVPEFRKKAAEFHDSKHPRKSCPQKNPTEDEPKNQEPPRTFIQRFLDIILPAKNEEPVQAKTRNPNGAGPKGNPTISYIKAFLLAPVLYIDQNATAIANHLKSNRDYYKACGFRFIPSERTLQDFDQIMSEYGLWERVREFAYQENVEKEIINEKAEDTINIDNVHIVAFSGIDKKCKECRECPLKVECTEKIPTDETAGWYIKSKCKRYYAHMVGVSQLAKSGAPLDRVVLKGSAYEPDTLKPLLEELKGRENLKIDKINADGIFNSESSRQTIKEVYSKYADLVANVNPRRQKDPQVEARGIEKVTKYGTVNCIAGHEMVCLGKDNAHESLIYGCPVYNEKARNIIQIKGKNLLGESCTSKELCCPNAENGRYFRLKQSLVPKVDADRPQVTLGHWLIYSLRTKIERLFGYLKKRLHMENLYVRGKRRIEGHIDKFLALIHIIAGKLGHYPV